MFWTGRRVSYVLFAGGDIVVEELAPFWPAPRAVPRRVNEDQMTGVSTNAVEVQLLSTSLSGSMSDDLSLAKTTPHRLGARMQQVLPPNDSVKQ